MEGTNRDLTVFTKGVRKQLPKEEVPFNRYDLRSSTEKIKNYSLEEIERILKGTSLIEQQKLSKNFYNKDGFYSRIIDYLSTLPTYSYIIIPMPHNGQDMKQEHLKKKYFQACEYMDSKNIAEMLTRWSNRALTNGSYYGIVQKLDKKELIILDLPTGYCTSRFKDIHGNDVIEFDLSYFNTIKNEQIKEAVLKTYPSIISDAYRRWRKGKGNGTYWFQIPTEIGVCFSVSDSGRPPLINTIPSLIHYDETVDIELQRDLEEIKKIVVQHVPHLNDGQLVFEPDEALEMHKGTVDMMSGNKNVSVLTSYADVDAIVSKSSNDAASNNLERMSQNIYATAGVSAQLFAPTGTQSLKTSILNDLSFMGILTNKYSRFFSQILNNLFGNSNIQFKFKILPVSLYNQSDYISDSLKLAQSGYSFLIPGIAMGLSQLELSNIKTLENDVLKLRDLLIPLESSYTQSASDGVGAPEKKVEDKSDKTIANENSINNQGGEK